MLSVSGELTWCLRTSKGSTTGVKTGSMLNRKQLQHWNNKRKITSTITPRVVLFSLSDLVSGVGRKLFASRSILFDLCSEEEKRRIQSFFFFLVLFSLSDTRYKYTAQSLTNIFLERLTVLRNVRSRFSPAHINSYMKFSHMCWKSIFSECWGHFLVLNCFPF